MNKIEIMSPAGSLECMIAALNAGADSVYFGVEALNMRSHAANNFKLKDLPKIARLCQKHNAKSYLTVNSILYDEDIPLMQNIILAAKKANISAIIASDIAAIEYCKKIGIECHISTQTNVSNISAVKFFSNYADVIVLARELSLEQIKGLISQIKKQHIVGPSGNLIQIEVFVHGALCVSIAGKCHMSLALYNSSANRGACFQTCRRAYRVIDEETGDELIIDNRYVMSPKDLCTIGMIDKLIDAGVTVFKIEGRGRSADYVYKTTKVYKEAVSAYFNGEYNKVNIAKWTKELESVYNRGFWQNGYYLGKKLGDWSGTYGSKATVEKSYVGKIKNYFKKAGVAEVCIEAGSLNVGDDILITGPTTGALFFKAEKILLKDKPSNSAKKGDMITIPIKVKVRKNDKLYVLSKVGK